MEYLQVDSHSFVTDDEDALSTLFGCTSDEGAEPRIALKRIAQRLSTVFATLKVRWGPAGAHGSRALLLSWLKP